jgi:tetratricopeptide (TPR) repeat protein
MLQQYLKRYDDAETAFRKAVELDPYQPWLWIVYGNFLADPLKKYEDAAAVYRKAIELNPNEPWLWIRYANFLAEPLKRYEDAAAAYRKAIELNTDDLDISRQKVIESNPDNLDISLALARILVKGGKWDDAVAHARKFISEGDDEYHERNWPDIIGFFREAVASGNSDEAAALLDETEYGERWRPLREALQAIAEDDSSHLLRLAPEIRRPAEEIVATLLPEGARLGSAPKTARARRTRRKKPLNKSK